MGFSSDMPSLDNAVASLRVPTTRRVSEKYLLLSFDLLLPALLIWSIRALFDGISAADPSSGGMATGIRGALLVAAISAFALKGHYTKRKPIWSEMREVIQISMLMLLLDAAVSLFANDVQAKASILVTWVLFPLVLISTRVILKKALISMGGWIRPVAIIGWGVNLVETALAFEDEPLMGYRIVAFLVPPDKLATVPKTLREQRRNIPFISLGAEPQSALRHLGNPHVVYAPEPDGIADYRGVIQKLSHVCHDLQIVPPVCGLPLYGMEVTHFFRHEVLLLSIRDNLARLGPRVMKRGFDIVVSLLLLGIGSPVLLGICFLVSRTKGPVFFGHERIGQNGKTFRCYKFRTMQPNAAQLLQELLARDPEARAEWERDFKLKNDPRITPVGNFLRKTSLDELPQLWNVLKGEMSLVGPRPVVDAELERYGEQVDLYLKAKPGLTGLWQISGRNDVSYDSRVYLDAWYVKNWSFFNDIAILIRTAKVVFGKSGAY